MSYPSDTGCDYGEIQEYLQKLGKDPHRSINVKFDTGCDYGEIQEYLQKLGKDPHRSINIDFD